MSELGAGKLPNEAEAILEVVSSDTRPLLRVSVRWLGEVKALGTVSTRRGVEARIKRVLLCEGLIRRGIFLRFVPEDDEAVRSAVSTALERGSASFKVKVRGFKLTEEEKLLTRLLRRMGFRVVKCAIIEGYTVDLLLPDHDLAVELVGLTEEPGYEERALEKDPEKLKLVTGKKGYHICWIDIRDFRKNPKKMARLIAQMCKTIGDS